MSQTFNKVKTLLFITLLLHQLAANTTSLKLKDSEFDPEKIENMHLSEVIDADHNNDGDLIILGKSVRKNFLYYSIKKYDHDSDQFLNEWGLNVRVPHCNLQTTNYVLLAEINLIFIVCDDNQVNDNRPLFYFFNYVSSEFFEVTFEDIDRNYMKNLQYLIDGYNHSLILWDEDYVK